jgi:hypothetical protein
MTGKGQPRLRHPCRLCNRIVQPVCAWNQKILSNGNKSGTCSPIIRYIKRSRREILISIKSDIKSHPAKDPNREDQRC